MTDYDQYVMSLKEKVMYILLAAAFLYTVTFIFYHSHAVSILVSVLAVLYPRIRTKELIKKRKEKLRLQFKDMLYALSSALSAGKSVETGLREIVKDLEVLYPDPETMIIKELQIIIRKLDTNDTVEAALEDFARRAHVDDIANFQDVFQTCKRTGGNMVEIIKNASSIINDKIEIRQEIRLLLAQRKFEQKVLNVLPILLILLLTFSVNDYISCIFSTAQGRFAMTLSLILLGIAYVISKKIMDIKV